MAYDEFTLEALKQQFGLQTDERGDYFARAEPEPVSESLREHLQKYVPRAIAIGTEKARSEFIVVRVLIEVVERFHADVSLHPGVEFNPDPSRGLRGVCDFLLSLAPEWLTVEAPVIAVVEAKNDNVRNGINQCIAEMVAAQVFNRAKGNSIETIYGVVTTGTNWIFFRLRESIVYIDLTEYYISQVDKIVGILLFMLREASVQAAAD